MRPSWPRSSRTCTGRSGSSTSTSTASRTGTLGGQTAIGTEGCGADLLRQAAPSLSLHEAALLAACRRRPSQYYPSQEGPAASPPPQPRAGQDGRAPPGHPQQAEAAKKLRRPQPSDYFQRRRESYFFGHQGRLIKEYQPAEPSSSAASSCTTIDLDKQRKAREERPRHPARRHRAVVGAHDDQPEERLHPRDGVPSADYADSKLTSPPRASASPARRSRRWR